MITVIGGTIKPWIHCPHTVAGCGCRPKGRAVVAEIVQAVVAIGWRTPGATMIPPCPKCAEYHGSKPCRAQLRRR